ncbi:ribonuclease P protein component [Lysinibacillus sphaericus]
MRKEQRVKKNKEFQEIFKKGTSFANRQFVLYSLKQEEAQPFRIGISVSKKIGNAVCRNRIKRYIRQAFLELREDVQDNHDYLIIARKPAADMDFHEVKSSITHVLKRGKVLKKTSNGKNDRKK